MLHLETFSGIAGNMFLGALLDLGLSRRALVEDLSAIDVDFRLKVRTVHRGALAARYVDVRVPGGAPAPGKKASARHSSGKKVPARQAHAHGRHYTEIVKVLEGSRLRAPVKERALAVFEALGRAEARVHGTRLEKVHFHEVGAVDAIVDIAGAAIGLDRLGIQRVTATPVALGHGRVDTQHGTLPLPAPATLELLKGLPVVPAEVAWETVTPTGAALLRCLVDEFRQLPAMTLESVGLGAGNDRPGPLPNVLRAVLGRAGGAEADRVVVLETHLDDQNPEHFAYLMERLFATGALDVALQHLQMKKNRPGFGLRVLCRPAERGALSRLLMTESTAIGVRASEWDRLVLPREIRRVETPYGRIRVKVVWHDGGAEVSPELEDCVRAARRRGAALREVVRAAEQAGRETLS